ncbi:predicted protein [Nematostella vectensis]|uniref:DNA-(apurinic or apyrimidinic site) endonuclease n=1 Tax=Nematostella vectensis TaxID=45351 RepID=A7RQL6_NEMVE|nr:predicted protein [Nematostella vectensis]|eukprot:XP_001638192.1 predicted protein [Nematostella vectensis]
MKILTWNINGLRAVTREKKLKDFLNSLEADVMCFQETKITRDMLEEATCMADGYTAFFSFSRVKSGYSGVATFCKDSTTPLAAEEGLTSQLSASPDIGFYGDDEEFTSDQLSRLDSEGRTILTEHTLSSGGTVVIINVYCPRADMENEDRIQFKLEFHRLLSKRVKALLNSGKHVIVLGDINAAHKPIDHCNPCKYEDFSSFPGRAWLDELLVSLPLPDNSCDSSWKCVSGLLIDSFRYFHPLQREAYTNWSTSTGARQTNYGTRIDYILVDPPLLQQEFVDCVIRPEVEGSDHCPVVCTLKNRFLAANKTPLLCTKFMPEFSGKQQKLVSFFTKKTDNAFTVPTDLNNEKVISETELSASNTTKKRAPSSGSAVPNPKRAKTEKSTRQNTLLNFFGSKNVTKASSPKCIVDIVTDKPSGEVTREDTKSNQNMLLNPEPYSSVSAWKSILKGPPPAPLCPGHNEPSVLRTVKKKGPNYGRQFYCCARPEGHASNKEARCNFFKWRK